VSVLGFEVAVVAEGDAAVVAEGDAVVVEFEDLVALPGDPETVPVVELR